jgi:alkylhydroperoxidase family enzyme
MPGAREAMMKPMYLEDVESHHGTGPRADAIEQMRDAGIPIPQIMHLFAFKPDRTDHLAEFTQGVMRGPSPLPPGQRELIAALTSKLNQCLF